MRLSYDTAGRPETLLLHGFLGSGKDFSGFTDNYIAPDLPGHGTSVGLPYDAYSMQGAAEAVVALLGDFGVEETRLVGYSMGGRLALYLALNYPEKFPSLVMESASPGLVTDEERRTRRTADDDLARRLEASNKERFRGFLEGWHRQPLFASLADHEGLVEKLVSERLNNDPQELAKSLRGMGTGSQPALWSELPNLAVPTLAVVGATDSKFQRIAHEMSALSPNISVAVVPGAGHNVHVERPQEFARLLAANLG